MTIVDVVKAKKFLTMEQEWGLIDTLTKGCNSSIKNQIRCAIAYRFYSLSSLAIWSKFTIVSSGVIFETKGSRAKELKELREDILNIVATQ